MPKIRLAVVKTLLTEELRIRFQNQSLRQDSCAFPFCVLVVVRTFINFCRFVNGATFIVLDIFGAKMRILKECVPIWRRVY